MKRALKYLLSLLAAFVVLGFAVGTWLIHDGDWIRMKAQKYVSDVTGRQFSIDGPIDINLSLHPLLSAEDLHLANAPWAGDADLVRLRKLRFSIDLLSLFSDKLTFNFIEFEGLSLALEENDQGEVNWDLFTSEQQETEVEEPGNGKPGDDLPVRTDLFPPAPG